MIVSRTIDCFRSSAGVTAGLVPLQGDYRFRQLDAADFRASVLGQEKGRAETFTTRLKAGHEAWGYVDGSDAIACYLWLTMSTDGSVTANFECGLMTEIPAGTAYIWDCRSHPAHEGRGLYRHGLKELRTIAFSRGAKTVLIVTRRENVRSATSIMKVGFERFAVLRLLAFRGVVLLRRALSFRMLRAGAAVCLIDGD